MKEQPLPNRFLVDFDQTLCNSHFNPKTGKYDTGGPIEAVVSAVVDQYFKGNEIIIFTSRPKKEWPVLREWLDREGVPYSGIKKKPLAKAYIDDKAMRPDEFIIFNMVEDKL
jgi:hypothetical protein